MKFIYLCPSDNVPDLQVESFTASGGESTERLIKVTGFNHFAKLLGVMKCVFKFVNILKSRILHKGRSAETVLSDRELTQKANNYLVRQEQIEYAGDEILYLTSPGKIVRDIPRNVQKFNLYIDSDRVMRVKSKFGRWKESSFHPIFLPKESSLVELLVEHYHIETGHGGVYNVLNRLRKKFWIPNIFVLAKKR